MDWLRFSCGRCGQHLKARPEDGGSVTVCPVCEAVIRVPPAGASGPEPGALPVAAIVTADPRRQAPENPVPVQRVEPGETGDTAGDAVETSTPPGSDDGAADSAEAGLADAPAGERSGPSGPGAAILLVGLVLVLGAIGLWIWQPWKGKGGGETAVAPSAVPPVSSPPPAPPVEPAPPPPEAGPPPPVPATPPLEPPPAKPPRPEPATPEAGREPAPEAAGIERWMASWEVDFSTLPADATRAVELQLEPLGLSVSPSLYSATSGQQIRWPDRRGTRLEAIEWVGRQLGWIPEYEAGRLKFRRGRREEPAAFAGPFMALVAQVSPSDRWGTATLRIRLVGVGLPDAVRERWPPAALKLRHWEARSPAGDDLADPLGEHRLLPLRGTDTRLVELWQEVELWHAFRGVHRIARLTASIEPPPVAGVTFPALRFEWRDVPLKPAPTTPEREPPLVFEGDSPVLARLYSVIPDTPHDRARIEVENRADRPLRRVRVRFTYLDATGQVAGSEEQLVAGEGLPAPRTTRRLDGLVLWKKPDTADRVRVEAVGAVFLGGAEWKRAP